MHRLSAGKPAPSSSSGSLSTLGVDPEVASVQSETGSQESATAEQLPAAQLCSDARRWGRLQLRQDSKLWSPLYRPYWAGLANGLLYLYRRETDAAQKRSINLSGYEVRQPPPGADINAKRRPSCFELVKPGGHTHQLLALTPKDARQWMAALEAEGVLAGKSEREPAEEAPPRPRPPAPPPAGPDEALAVTAATAAAAAAAAAASVPLKGPSEPPQTEPVEEDLYYEPGEEEDIYEDISWPAAGGQRPPSLVQPNRVSQTTTRRFMISSAILPTLRPSPPGQLRCCRRQPASRWVGRGRCRRYQVRRPPSHQSPPYRRRCRTGPRSRRPTRLRRRRHHSVALASGQAPYPLPLFSHLRRRHSGVLPAAPSHHRRHSEVLPSQPSRRHRQRDRSACSLPRRN